MTMLTVRLKALRNNPNVFHDHHKHPFKRRDRVTRAVNGACRFEKLHLDVRLLMVERACLRKDIARITAREMHKRISRASPLVSRKLKRIDKITEQLKLMEYQ